MWSVIFPSAQVADAIRAQLGAGVTALTVAQAAARADIPVAQDLRATAQAGETAARTQRAGVAAFTPSATYKPGELAAVRDQLAAVLDRQAAILDALAGLYAYRAAVDRNAVATDDALLWLARLAAGLLEDPTT